MKKTLLAKLKENLNGGTILVAVAVITLIIANSSLAGAYQSLLKTPILFLVGTTNILGTGHGSMTLLDVVNDVLMTIFFFSVGLEIKKEILVGELASVRKALLPIIAACGGMIVPVVMFALVAPSDPGVMRGCAIPMATDIAFSLGVLSLLGKRVPLSVKIFLMTLAVADDIGGILVIAIFYSSHLDWSLLALSLIPLTVLYIGSRMNISSKLFYLTLGIVVWYIFLHSGVHATISGVIVAFMIPARTEADVRLRRKKVRHAIKGLSEFSNSTERYRMFSHEEAKLLRMIKRETAEVMSPLQDISENIEPLVTYVIMPIFAFANAGVNLGDISFSAFELPLAVAVSLVFGKMIGIFAFTAVSVMSGWLKMPARMNYMNLFGISILGGIGFTVSLFIAELSYGGAHPGLLNEAKLGIIFGSVCAGVLGYVVLNKILGKDECTEEKPVAQ